jgi:PEP-CTERM motif
VDRQRTYRRFWWLSGYTGSLGTSVSGTTCVGSAPCDSFSPGNSFTFSGPATLDVQDLFESGDQFTVYDFGVAIGSTSAASNGPSCGNDPVACASVVASSKGAFSLGAGAHSISIQIISEASGFTTGNAAFELVASAVPEPTTVSLMALGLGGLLFGWRARRKA